MRSRLRVLTLAAVLCASTPAATQQPEPAVGVPPTPRGDPDLRRTWLDQMMRAPQGDTDGR